MREYAFAGCVFQALAFSPDSRLLAIGLLPKDKRATGSLQTLHIYDWRQNVEIETPSVSVEINCLDFSPDGRFLAFGDGENQAKVLAVGSKVAPRRFVGHRDHVVRVRFSPDGSRLLGGAWDGWVRMWNVQTGRELFAIEVDRHQQHAGGMTFERR